MQPEEIAEKATYTLFSYSYIKQNEFANVAGYIAEAIHEGARISSMKDTPPRTCEYYTLRFQGQFFETMLDDAQAQINSLAEDGWRLHTYTLCELADAGPTVVAVLVRDRSKP